MIGMRFGVRERSGMRVKVSVRVSVSVSVRVRVRVRVGARRVGQGDREWYHLDACMAAGAKRGE